MVIYAASPGTAKASAWRSPATFSSKLYCWMTRKLFSPIVARRAGSSRRRRRHEAEIGFSRNRESFGPGTVVGRKETGDPDATASKIVHRLGKQGCKREGEHGGRSGSHNGILQQPIECPQRSRSDEATANGEAVRDAGARPQAKMMPVLVQVQGMGADAERAEGVPIRSAQITGRELAKKENRVDRHSDVIQNRN
jgi:hypothetical protein